MIRNAVGSATDSLRDVLAIVLGRVQRTQGRSVVEEGREALTKIGGNVLTEVSGIHDRLLERYGGRQVVSEVLVDGEIHEHVGLLKEYSADFLHVLDVQYPHNRYVEVEPDGTAEADAVTAADADRRLRPANRGEQPLLVVSITVGDHSQMVNAIVDAGRTIDLRVAAAEPETARVHVQTARELDIIVPRSRCVVRHRAEKPASRDIGEYATAARQGRRSRRCFSGRFAGAGPATARLSLSVASATLGHRPDDVDRPDPHPAGSDLPPTPVHGTVVENVRV